MGEPLCGVWTTFVSSGRVSVARLCSARKHIKVYHNSIDDRKRIQVLFWPNRAHQPRDPRTDLGLSLELGWRFSALPSWVRSGWVPYKSTSLNCSFRARCELRPDPCPDLE